jgi:hypothetical protein
LFPDGPSRMSPFFHSAIKFLPKLRTASKAQKDDNKKPLFLNRGPRVRALQKGSPYYIGSEKEKRLISKSRRNRCNGVTLAVFPFIYIGIEVS